MVPRVAFVLCCWAALVPAPAAADEDEVELARTYFAAGTGHYLRKDYARAITAFEEARRLQPLPELDFDIGRCYEALDRPREALAAYERYLQATHDATAVVQERVAHMRALVRKERRRFVPAGVVAGVDVAVAGLATGLVASVASPLADLKDRYAIAPTPALQNDAHALEKRAIAGYALFGLAGALTIVDVALWITAARHRRGAAR
jgi:tetratricopeptide (TPR) repeat protein